MAKFVALKASGLTALRELDERLVSYNVEMTEVTGDELPELAGERVSGSVTLAPGACAFILV